MSAREQQVRRRQWLFGGGAIAIIAAVALGASVLMTGPSAAPPPTIPQTTTLAPGVKQSDKDAWQSKNSAEMESLRRAMTDLQTRQEFAEKEAKARAEAEKVQRDAARLAPPTPPTPTTAPPADGVGPFRTAGLQAPGVPGAPGRTPGPPTPAGYLAQPPRSQITSLDLEPGEQPPGQGGPAVAAAKQFGSEQERVKRNDVSTTGDPMDPLSPNRAAGQTAETYIPTGSFFKAVLLNGMDAPTGGQAQQNPSPVVLQLVDDGQLPNGFRGSLKDCLVTANGVGDLSSERALLRTDRLSCIKGDGNAIDIEIKGYIAGKDGKTGVRGRLVSKTGTALANAIWAAGVGSIGKYISGASRTNTTNALGVQTTNVENPGRAALGDGVDRAFDRLAQYYINLADKLFPVIEIDGSQTVDIVITRGFSVATN